MKLKVLALVTAAAFCVGSLAGCGGSAGSPKPASEGDASGEQVYNFSIAHAVSEESTQHAACLALKEYLETNSNGRIKLTIYPNAQLGADREALEGVQEGSITMMTGSPATQANFVGSAAIFDLPFAFATVDEIETAFTNQEFLDALGAEYEKADFHMMGVSNWGFRITTSNFPIQSTDDLKGFTIRTMENQNHIATWKALGANPTPIAMNELYTALQQGTVDGQENPMQLIYTQKIYEQQKYISKTNHLPHCLVWVMNKDTYNALPDDLKAVVDGGAQAALKAGAEHMFSHTEEYEEKLKGLGNEIVELSPEQLKPFQEKVAPVWETIREQVAPEIFDAYISGVKK